MRAAALITAVILVGACTSTSTDESTTTSSMAPVLTTTSEPPTTTTLEAIPVWVRAETPTRDASLGGADTLFALVEFDGRLFAAGQVGLQPAVWVSDDGLKWTSVSDPDIAVPVGKIRDLVVGGPGLVAVGEAFTGESWAPRPAIWASADGRHWARIPHDLDVFGAAEGGSIGSVTTGPDGLIALGGEFYGQGITVWRSIDGLEWTRLPPNDLGAVDDLTVLNGTYVAVGAEHEGNASVAAAWLSSDGLDWSRATVRMDYGTGTFQEMRGVNVWNGSLLAVGFDADFGWGIPAVWMSEDGSEWVRVRDDGLRSSVPDPTHSQMWAVSTGEDALIAVGWYSDDDSDSAAVWRSSDGLSWRRDEADVFSGRYAQNLFATAPFLGGIAVVGSDSSEGPFAAAWYIGPSSASADRGSPPDQGAVLGGLRPVPYGLSVPAIIDALGGRERPEPYPPVYPPFYVDFCWDAAVGTAVLYVTDPSLVDVEALEPYLGGAPLTLVWSKYSRDQFLEWESLAQRRMQTQRIYGAFNFRVVAHIWEGSGRSCSETPYLLFEVYPDSHDADLTRITAGIPPEVVVTRLVYAVPTDY